MFLQILLYAIALGMLLLAASRLATEIYSRSKIFSVEDTPPSRVAIVFGAGLWRDGSPTAVLRDRIATAVQLYKAGKVQKLLMSGDNRQDNYNEPASMKEFAIKLGIPEKDIVLDYAGLRTYDTCYRAKEIFGLSEAVLVTQHFHLPRAVFICNNLGVKAVGAIADQRQYTPHTHQYWKLREIIASFVALWDVWVAKPSPILGDPEPIFPAMRENSSTASWEPKHDL
ncbi:MAG: YdcF family protein [Anaerolineaceae bacterium]|nr:YdcF family protein [Anaerolineaceae bacterium]